MKILIRRAGAMGDVVTTTPIPARLKLLYPEAEIDIVTQQVAVYEGPGYRNPHITRVVAHADPSRYDKFIDLDMVHERDRGIHPIDMFMEEAFGDREGCKDVVFPLAPKPPVLGFPLDWSKIICLHANTSWQNRTLPQEFWQEVANKLIAAGYTIMTIGTSIDKAISGFGIIDTNNKLSLYQQAAAMHHSRALVCGMSGIEQLAWATDVPIVAFVTTTPIQCATPWRHGEFGWNWHRLITNLECRGCAAEVKNATFVGCRVGGFPCTQSFSSEDAFQLTMHAIKNDRRVGYGKNL